MLEAGWIAKEDYDKWRYRYPEFDQSQKIAEVIIAVVSIVLRKLVCRPWYE